MLMIFHKYICTTYGPHCECLSEGSFFQAIDFFPCEQNRAFI